MNVGVGKMKGWVDRMSRRGRMRDTAAGGFEVKKAGSHGAERPAGSLHGR